MSGKLAVDASTKSQPGHEHRADADQLDAVAASYNTEPDLAAAVVKHLERAKSRCRPSPCGVRA